MTLVDDAARVFDLLADAPEGLTIHQIAQRLGCTRSWADQSVRKLRRILGEDDDVWVLCDPHPADRSGPWVYQLRTALDFVDAEATAWTANRVTDLESRLVTMRSGAAAAARVGDGRTKEGRKARLIFKYLTRLEEDLGELAEAM